MSSIKKNIAGKKMTAKKGLKIGIVCSEYNSKIVEALHRKCVITLLNAGVKKKNIYEVQVPGAFEIPFACQKLAETKKFHVLISLGAVIRGETPHFEYVAGSCAQGIMDASLMTGVPIVFGVLTTENAAQAKARSDKGAEVALAAITISNLNIKF